MNSLQTQTSQAIVPADVEPIDLQIALAGDLSRLTPEAKLKFYGAVCQTTGLNPVTKPFDWLTFQGKTVLYANKGCAEQLRKIHGVTIEIIERKVEYGCLIVRVKATDKSGRVDESIGALPFNEKAGGEAAANAMMKCETKAKRRVTLSICGLGMLDESELDTMRETPASPIVSAMNGEDSASARAEKLNAQLTAGEKSKAVEVVSEISEAGKGDLSGDQHAAPGHEVDTQSPIPASVSTPAPSAPSAPSAPPAARQEATEPASGLLTEDEVSDVMAAFSACAQPKRAVEYCVYRGWLPKGAGLENLLRSAFLNITKKTPAFVRMVDGWKGDA